MSHVIVDIFKKKLYSLQISDYHGLISPGLTCYLNGVLQVLFMTEEFRDTIKRCSSEDMESIDTHLKALFTSLEKNPARTHDMTQILGITDVYEQRDAAEYFEKILRLASPKASKIFKGELNYVTRCCECKKKNKAPGFFWILPLSIKDPHQTFSVKEGLEAFFRKEKVSDENQMYCTQCDKKQDAIIECEMTQPPDVLTLLLKRFHYDYKLKCNVKLECKAEVPHTLHIKDCTYELYAIVRHFGNLSGGHYTAYIYSFQTKEWYNFNDNRVKLMGNNLGSGKTSVSSSTSYLLMYKKMSRVPENMTENEQKAHAAAPDTETLNTAANDLMEANCNGFGVSLDKDDDKMFSERGAENLRTVRHGLISPRLQRRRENSPVKSKSQMSHIGVGSMGQNSIPNILMSKKSMTTVKSPKTVQSTDFGRNKDIHHRHSPKTSRKQDHTNLSLKGTKHENHAKPWK